MGDRRVLVCVSSAQLAFGLTGVAVAIARRLAYDIPLMRGDPQRIRRDAILMGTAFSAPAVMLGAQGLATARLASSPDARAVRTLRVLGSVMVAGYLAERLVRHRLTPNGWDPLESSIVAGGLLFAAAMAVLGPAGE